MRRFVLISGLVLVILVSTLAFLFHDFFRAYAWHERNGDSVSIGSHRVAIPNNWEPSGPPNDLDMPTEGRAVIVRAAIMPWSRSNSSVHFEPLDDVIESDAVVHDLVQAWARGDEGRFDLAASEVVTIKGRSISFHCVRRVYHNHEVGLMCLATGFEYNILSVSDSKVEAQVKDIIASIE